MIVTGMGALRTLTVWFPKFTICGTMTRPGALAEFTFATKTFPAKPFNSPWVAPAITGKLVEDVLPVT